MLTEIHLKNFKAWRDTGPVRLAPVTMLLGTNSSGKSSLIQSLLLLKQTALSPDRSIHLNLGGDEVNDLFNFGDFDNVLSAGVEGVARRFELAFKFRRPATERVEEGEFSCSYGQTSNGAVVAQEAMLGTDRFVLRVLRREKGAFSLVVNDESQPRGKGRDFAPERSIALPPPAIVALGSDGSLVQDLSLAIRRELESLRYLGPLRRKPERDYVWNKTSPGDIGSDGSKTMDALLASAFLRDADQAKILQGVAAWLKRMKVADHVEARQVGRSTRYELVVSRDGVDANIRDVGIGISQVLPVLTLAHFAPVGSTIILEEPEIHLHPLAQAVLAELFVETSRKRKVQFIVETHSEHLFRRMQTLIAQQKTTSDECAMYFVERAQKQARLRALQVDEFGAVSNWPEHFFGDSVGEARAQAQARAQRMRGAVNG
jgi:predicted ATPase